VSDVFLEKKERNS